MHALLHCLSSQNYIAKLGSCRRESTLFWLLNQVSIDISEEHPFIFIKLFIAVTTLQRTISEVSIRIALLQRKTLIETKNRTLKCLKWHYSTVRSMKNIQVLTEDGAFALFFRPHPLEFAIQGKKLLMSGGQRGVGTERSWN